MNPEERQAEIELMKKHVLQYSQPDDKTAWLMLALSIAIEGVAIAFIHMGYRLIGWSIHTLCLVRLFIQFHDMAHFSYFSSIQTNTIVGKLIGVLTHQPFNAWRDGHNHHHKHYGNLDKPDLSQTILFTKKQYQQMKGAKKIVARIIRDPFVFFFFTVQYSWFIRLFQTIAKRYGIFSLTFFQKVMSVVLYSLICPYLLGVPAFEMWFSMYVVELIGALIFHLEHSVNNTYRERTINWDPMRASLEGSTYLHIPLILKPFSNGVEYHHIHHINTNVPSYRLEQCHQSYDKLTKDGKQWDKFNINRVGFKQAMKSLSNAIYDEEKHMCVPF